LYYFHLMESDKRLDLVFQALADRNRRQILSLLSERKYPVSELAEELNAALASVSKHVSYLERSGLVYKERSGRRIFCNLNRDSWFEVSAFMSQFPRFWQTRLDELESFIEEQKE